jgi:hypothetical protein
MAALNAMDSTGVCQDVIDTVSRWRDWLDGVDDDRRPRNSSQRDFELMQMDAVVDYNNTATVRDARYLVACLEAFLPLERIRNNRPRKKTILHLWDTYLSNRALAVICAFLRQPNCLLTAIYLELSPKQAL